MPREINRFQLPSQDSNGKPIDVFRDDHGVFHIEADSQQDWCYALGHCHALDRTLPMVLMSIIGQGRGCELLEDSEEMLHLDRMFRRINLYHGTQSQIDELSPHHRKLTQSYCDGINDRWSKEKYDFWPWELKLLKVRRTPWTIAQTFLISRLTAYIGLAQTQGDIERFIVQMVKNGVTQNQLDELFPGKVSDLDETLIRKVKLGETLIPKNMKWSSVLPSIATSNSWVIHGSKTRSGKPILCNDPHLEINRLPGVWYEAVFKNRRDGQYCIASTLPGLPVPILGRQKEFAWGATYTYMDSVDSWIEQCSEGKYRRDVDGRSSWKEFRKRVEVIRRKKHSDVVVAYYENEHGTLDGNPFVEGYYFASKWATAHASGPASIGAMMEMYSVQTVEKGREVLGGLESAWNWVMCDRNGDIGYQMSGQMPLRGSQKNGLTPLLGWLEEDDWKGIVEPQDLPRLLNPEEGFIATANNDLNAYGNASPVNVCMGPSRVNRIEELLRSRDDWDAESCREMQLDLFSNHAQEFMEILRPLIPDTETGKLLKDWDCRYTKESQGAFLFEEFLFELRKEVFGRVLGERVFRHILEETSLFGGFFFHFDEVLKQPKSEWYGPENRENIYRRVVRKVLSQPVRRLGECSEMKMNHILFAGKLPGFLGFDYGPFEFEGGRDTICQAQFFRAHDRDLSFGPSYRIVTDMSEDCAYTALASGVNDRRFSKWYTQGVSDWIQGRLKKLSPSSD